VVPKAGGSSPLRHPKSNGEGVTPRRYHEVMVVIDDLPRIPDELRARAAGWSELKRWERRELGQELRRVGLSYTEIRQLIPVPTGTLSQWCRDVLLDDELRARLALKRPRLDSVRALGARRRAEALDRIASIRGRARAEVPALRDDPEWTAGLVAYWAEGTKRAKELQFSNSDPAMILLFIRWLDTFLEIDRSRLNPQLHLHSGQDEEERKRFWSEMLGIHVGQFRKAFFKVEGTGHRKNILYNGTISIRVRRSGEAFQRVLGWIEGYGGMFVAKNPGSHL
jgi:hypothetical protein